MSDGASLVGSAEIASKGASEAFPNTAAVEAATGAEATEKEPESAMGLANGLAHGAGPSPN